ncbi:MAG: hypothetical protein ACUVTG_15005 [Candidatus Oleimicrobiaceae bacterium]
MEAQAPERASRRKPFSAEGWAAHTRRLPWAFVLPWAAVALIGCTHNPFGDDQIRTPAMEIRGRVMLQDSASPEGVYVWLEHFDVATWTDEGGQFRLPISPTAGRAGTGVTGSFRLFFYLGNYALQRAEVVLRDGELVPGHGDLDPQGSLRPVLLPRLLTVITSVQPDTFPPRVAGDISPVVFEGAPVKVTVTLRADVDSVVVLVPGRRAGPAAALFIQALDPVQGVQFVPPECLPALLSPLVQDTITPVGRSWNGGFYLAAGALPKGRYEIVPYVMIPQESLPVRLLSSLGASPTPGLSYLRLPFKRQKGILNVLP